MSEPVQVNVVDYLHLIQIFNTQVEEVVFLCDVTDLPFVDDIDNLLFYIHLCNAVGGLNRKLVYR